MSSQSYIRGESLQENLFLKARKPAYLVLSLAFLSLFSGCSAEKEVENKSKEISKNPPRYEAVIFERTAGSDSLVQLSSPDSLTMVMLWATWCQSCRAEMPTIAELQQIFASQKVRFLGLSMDERPEKVLPRFLSQIPVPFQVVLPTAGLRIDLGLSGNLSLPTTYLINQEGKIVYQWTGPQSLHGFRKEISAHIR
jgi:thiol-disulfide isomerase/thioredoxin